MFWHSSNSVLSRAHGADGVRQPGTMVDGAERNRDEFQRWEFNGYEKALRFTDDPVYIYIFTVIVQFIQYAYVYACIICWHSEFGSCQSLYSVLLVMCSFYRGHQPSWCPGKKKNQYICCYGLFIYARKIQHIIVYHCTIALLSDYEHNIRMYYSHGYVSIECMRKRWLYSSETHAFSTQMFPFRCLDLKIVPSATVPQSCFGVLPCQRKEPSIKYIWHMWVPKAIFTGLTLHEDSEQFEPGQNGWLQRSFGSHWDWYIT